MLEDAEIITNCPLKVPNPKLSASPHAMKRQSDKLLQDFEQT